MDMTTLLLAFLGGFIGLLGAEFRSWAPLLANRLTKAVARIAPEDLRERLVEEWLGHVAAVPGALSKIVVALGLVVAATRIRFDRRELGWVRLFDVCISLMTLFIMVPLFVFLAAGLAIEGKQKPLAWRPTPGRQGLAFRRLAFRLVYRNQDDETRLAGFSAFIVKRGLHELPDYVNILQGNMSLFGPGVSGCACEHCEAARLNLARPGFVSLDKVEQLARDLLGWEVGPAKGEGRRYLRALGLAIALMGKSGGRWPPHRR